MMKASKHIADDIGGGYKPSSAIANLPANSADQHSPADDIADLYTRLPAAPPRPYSIRNRQKAKAIAEARLNQLSEELLELADELRSLNPAMADALDTAWQATDEAIETLLNPQAW